MSITSVETRQKLKAKGWKLWEEGETCERWRSEYDSVFLYDDGTHDGFGRLDALCEFAAIAGIQLQGYRLVKKEDK